MSSMHDNSHKRNETIFHEFSYRTGTTYDLFYQSFAKYLIRIKKTPNFISIYEKNIPYIFLI